MTYLKFFGIALLIGMALITLYIAGCFVVWRFRMWRRDRAIQARLDRRFWG